MESLHVSFQRVVDAGQWNESNINTIVHVLDCFHRASGLCINMSKSKLSGIYVDVDKVDQAARKTGYVTLKTPFTYIGSKVGGLMSRIQSWNKTMEGMVTRLSKWKMKTLSIKGVELAQFDLMLEKVEGTLLADIRDRWVWSLEGSGEFSVASVRKLIDDNMFPEVANKTMPIKVNVHASKVKLDFLPTRINISRRGMNIESILCPMCGEAAKSSRHIFFICHIAREILRKISQWWDVRYLDLSSYKEWLDWTLSLRLLVKHKQSFKGVCYAMWWHIWSLRNKSVFDSEIPSKAVIFEDVVSQSFYWCRYRCKCSFSWIEWLKNPHLISL
nr:RNA-directed DNA polymerase, eukaryota [Tanacetum cinerariifolium]